MNKISVALCTYNGEKFLERQLESILYQTIPVSEIVVCDDISNDATIAILEKYKLNYPEIFKIHSNSKNLKSNKNFEKAIKLTTGDYIFLSDQDDIWVNTKVEETLTVFKNNKTAEGVFSNASLIDDNDNILYQNISLWDSIHFFERLISKPINLYKLLILRGNYLTGATLCIKKSVKEFCFPFKTIEKSFLHDEWFAYILSKRKTLFYSPKKLISYRLHSNQQMGVGSIKNNLAKINKLPRDLGITLDIFKPKTFRDYKKITRTSFAQYEKYKILNLDKEMTSYLSDLYLNADANMKKSNPILYYFRKRKDKKKGVRQL